MILNQAVWGRHMVLEAVANGDELVRLKLVFNLGSQA